MANPGPLAPSVCSVRGVWDHRDGWEWLLLFSHGEVSQGPKAKATKANGIFVLKDNAGVKTRGDKMDRN